MVRITHRVKKPDAERNTMRTSSSLAHRQTRSPLHGTTWQPGRLVGRDARRNRRRFEWLEDRTLLATFVVSSTNDSGPGSLRQAILDSNSATGQTNTIDFNIPGSGRLDLVVTNKLTGQVSILQNLDSN